MRYVKLTITEEEHQALVREATARYLPVAKLAKIKMLGLPEPPKPTHQPPKTTEEPENTQSLVAAALQQLHTPTEATNPTPPPRKTTKRPKTTKDGADKPPRCRIHQVWEQVGPTWMKQGTEYEHVRCVQCDYRRDRKTTPR